MEKYVEEIIECYKRQAETVLIIAEKTDAINNRLISTIKIAVIVGLISVAFTACFISSYLWSKYFGTDYMYPNVSQTVTEERTEQIIKGDEK